MRPSSIGGAEGCAAMLIGRHRTNQGRSHRGLGWALALASIGVFLSGCSLQVSKRGISGNAFGHRFSGANGALPAGFPSTIPLPDKARVLVGGGADSRWDVGFAVSGSVASGMAAYQSKVEEAGYTVTNVQTGSSPNGGGAGSSSNPTETTFAMAASVFTAKNGQWTMEVVSANSTSVPATRSSAGGGLKAGEFAMNITIIPTSSVTPTS